MVARRPAGSRRLPEASGSSACPTRRGRSPRSRSARCSRRTTSAPSSRPSSGSRRSACARRRPRSTSGAHRDPGAAVNGRVLTTSEGHRTIDAVWRIESARLVAGLARIVRDVGLAEELAQDALVAALEQWPESGVPNNPGAWLMATAKHRAIDLVCRNERLARKVAQLGRELEAGQGPGAPDLDAAVDDRTAHLRPASWAHERPPAANTPAVASGSSRARLRARRPGRGAGRDDAGGCRREHRRGAGWTAAAIARAALVAPVPDQPVPVRRLVCHRELRRQSWSSVSQRASSWPQRRRASASRVETSGRPRIGRRRCGRHHQAGWVRPPPPARGRRPHAW